MKRKTKFRPIRFWIPEIMNRLRLPDWIFRNARRNEIAALLKQARKYGISLKSFFVATRVRSIISSAPKKYDPDAESWPKPFFDQVRRTRAAGGGK